MIHDIGTSYDPHSYNEEEPSILHERFLTCLNVAKEPIWSGNENQSKLSATIKLLNIKIENNLSERAVNQTIDCAQSFLPEINGLPNSLYNMKKLSKDLGLPVNRINACRKGCMLFWKTESKSLVCKFCDLPRYKNKSGISSPYKQLFHLPLAPRLQRLYASEVTAHHITWHARHRTKEGVTCHPSDGDSWKSFNRNNPEFASEPRNVRLGLSADGFAPFGQYGSPYSCWPVILTPYNLPPRMCMKSSYMFLSLIIPSPKSPGKNIDIFLQPLIEELKELWFNGVQSFDVPTSTTFNLRAMLLWTVSDFPAYGMLSGWSTHELHGGPVCMKSSQSFRLKHGKKPSYFDCHRKFLPSDHHYRMDIKHFVKKQIEMTRMPTPASGPEIFSQVYEFETAVNSPNETPEGLGGTHKWTKKSIFWELPYWKDHLIRHNLDFMHIEKNVFENIINIVMNLK